MRKATEKHGETRKPGEYFSPRSKVKDLILQRRSLPHFTSSNQETPMKPSQVPNRLSLPPLRRVLPPQSETCCSDRLGSPRQPPHTQGPICSPELNLGSQTNVITPGQRFHPVTRDRLGPPLYSAQHSGSFCSSQLGPVNQSHIDPSGKKTQLGVNHYASPQYIKDVTNHTPSFHIRGYQVPEPMITLSCSGSKTAKTQESNKAQSSIVRSPVSTVQLHRPSVTTSVNISAAPEVYPRHLSESGCLSPDNSLSSPQGHQPSPSTQSSDRICTLGLSLMCSPVASYQEQQFKRTSSSKKSIPAVDLNSSSQKRHREFEDSDKDAKKLYLEGTNSGPAQTLKPVLELPPETTDSRLCSELACGPSTSSELSSSFKPAQPPFASLSPKPCIKQAYIKSTCNDIVRIKESLPQHSEESLKKTSEENDKRNKSSTLLSPDVPQQEISNHILHSTSVVPLKTLSKDHKVGENKTDSSTPKSASKPNSGPLSCRMAGQGKKRPRRPVDTDELFTPDPMTYVVNPMHKSAKYKTDGATIKSPTSEKSSSSTAPSSSTPVSGSSYRKTESSRATGSPDRVDTADHPRVSLPTIALERVKPENLKLCSKDREPKSSFIASSTSRLKGDSIKCDVKHVSYPPKKVPLKTDAAAAQHASTFPFSQSTSLGRQSTEGRKRQSSEGERRQSSEGERRHSSEGERRHSSEGERRQSSEGERRHSSEGRRKLMNEEDSIDVELDLGLSFALDFDLTQSSHSSEEEQLLSLQEMMERVTKPPDTPEKGAFSEPSTPGHHSSQLKNQPLTPAAKPGLYKNNLDQMLKEITTNKKAKEIEAQLLTACKEDLLRIAEFEKAEENQEEGVSTEQQEFLQRYSLMSNAIREVPPGEVVFNLEKFGQIFNQDTLQLRRCKVQPQGTAQKTLLWSSPAQLKLHLNIGLFQEAYDCHCPCPTQVTRFLFKMMSVHNERMVSEKILQTLCDIACTAAYQIVKNESQEFKVWVPSLADVTLVLMNMGVAFVTLFPFENLQPPFTEGDLLEDIYIKSESPNNEQQSTFPDHNCNNILKYLCYCIGLCPRVYSDDELLLLLTVIGRVALDTRLILQASVELYPLQYKIVNVIRDWDTMLPRICLALTNLTDDHHNMCLLVQLLPDNTRGKQLRRHLSLSMISKLLDGNCTYTPAHNEFQLSNLRPYLPCMQPSTLFRSMQQSQKDKEQDLGILDQQSYYLCYSLLTLANEASNFQFFPAHQKEQLLCLCNELETHVKCDIRESEKCLYRSKVKDLVARIYTKWQMLLQRTRPLHDKLYDYWQPLLVDTLLSSQEEGDMDNSDNEEGTEMKAIPMMEEDEPEEEATEAQENEVVMTAVDQEEEEQDNKPDEKQGEMGDDEPLDEKNQMDEAPEPEGVHFL